ncbi:hypothetical protein GCWU000325_02839 [Alloprevotella tannerae ATCC 51259]|uniref:Uncharacterized protein n=1 Tax=Alloprevotella tannerae ATCC 51259 TaxID=626522 RepID=C9LKS0_9BACT|nr:hypothetical protein GCWU000325_02839 [Alloprevotella tannerae ATCC 51259]
MHILRCLLRFLALLRHLSASLCALCCSFLRTLPQFAQHLVATPTHLIAIFYSSFCRATHSFRFSPW